MQAIVHNAYGAPDVLSLQHIDRPAVGDSDVLVRVRAAALNPLDWHTMRGEPLLLRLGHGLTAPKPAVLGVDVAGRVEEVGPRVWRWHVGDDVFGVCGGALAEFACASQDKLAATPARLNDEQAAAVPVAAVTALQALRDRGRLQKGQQVLIVGASGGVGTFAVQIARALGGVVTGVCSTRNVELVRSLGADRVVDYTAEAYLDGGARYDLIIDMAGTHSLRACRRALTRRGTYVVVGAPSGRWVKGPDRFLKALALSLVVPQRMLPFVASIAADDLQVVKGLIDAGSVTPVIDRCYPLAETAAAMRHLETGHARGKVVVTI